MSISARYVLPVVVLMWVLLPLAISAEVLPEQVAVLVNIQNPASQELANYYMERRHIPPVNRVDLDLPTSNAINRDAYDKDLVVSVRKALRKKGLADTISTLVSVFGIPLRVRAPKPTEEEQVWIEDARGWRQSALNLLHEQEQEVRNLQARVMLAEQPLAKFIIPPPDTSGQPTTSKIRTWKNSLTTLLKTSHEDIVVNAHAQNKEEVLAVYRKIVRRMFGKFGVKAFSREMSGSSVDSKGEEVVAQQRIARLMQQPSFKTRTKAYGLVQPAFGLWGILALAHWEIERYGQADGSASVDSELSFLWWNAETYPVGGRLPNPLYLGYAGQVAEWPLPTLMVSRLDAPTPEHVRGMIDQSIETESRGLSGKVYVDARGIKKEGAPLSTGFYDLDMQNFATQFRKGSNYPVILENTEQRLSQPGDAPNVALYVGWYRLRHYENAFTFNPGAIGYHIASGEAANVHNPQESGWCKNALERGITVTLGPVDEPYLDAFPLPTEFFGLLYSGKYSLVEAYYLSTRYLSWKMVLFGDPLYRPWPPSDVGRQKVVQTLLQKASLPNPPSLHIFPSPNTEYDSRKFPGKYPPFDVRMLNP